MTAAPIVLTEHQGYLVVAGTADAITPALDGATPLTITGQSYSGDIVYTGGRQVRRDDATAADVIAKEVDHPTHGRVIYAYVDDRRLNDAPQARKAWSRYKQDLMNAAVAAEGRADAMVPDCDNCGDCAKCC